MYAMDLTVSSRRGTGAKRVVDSLWTGLCNTPGGMCTSWGHPGDKVVPYVFKPLLSCRNFVHGCGKKKVAELLEV
jgi:hypothetical protein